MPPTSVAISGNRRRRRLRARHRAWIRRATGTTMMRPSAKAWRTGIGPGKAHALARDPSRSARAIERVAVGSGADQHRTLASRCRRGRRAPARRSACRRPWRRAIRRRRGSRRRRRPALRRLEFRRAEAVDDDARDAALDADKGVVPLPDVVAFKQEQIGAPRERALDRHVQPRAARCPADS